ncbi:MAG TPA: 6-hydroxymethylpterin diphosphokinase MptE-like protein [Spirochaetia bacterium]|nr:6-hydroxymethylpterin diphosphokinase MptE-like protein [Spirochaetia bacterium]
MDDAGPLLVDTGSGLTVRYKGRFLYSPQYPKEGARRRALSAPRTESTLYFVPAPLLFYGVDDLIEALPAASHILCVETDQLLMRLSIDNAPQRIVHDNRITFLRTEDPDGVLAALRKLDLGRFRRCRMVILNGACSLSGDWYARMFELIEFELQSYWRNRMTLVHMSHLWVKNLFLNIPNMAGGACLLTAAVDRPIVVLGAGESLEGAIPLVREVRDRIYLLAVDTALLTLAESDVKPDGIMVLEAQNANLSDFVGYAVSGAAGILDLASYPEVVRIFPKEQRRFFFSHFAELSLFDRLSLHGLLPPALPPLGSVGIAALYAAMQMTDQSVFYAGLDFSYRPGKPHARGAPSHRVLLSTMMRVHPNSLVNFSLERPHREVTGKDGGRLWTDSNLASYGQNLGLLASGSRRLYDLGRTGIPSGPHIVGGIGELIEIMNREGSEPKMIATRAAPGRFATRSALEFLAAERELHAALQSVGQPLLSRSAGAGDGMPAAAQFLHLLKELDYVYLHFPDRPSADDRLPDEGFMKRALEASDTCVRWIDRAIHQIRAPQAHGQEP